MEGKCMVNSCGKADSKCCGLCGLVRYCSVDCQKKDWKTIHKKKECVSMKNLASVSLTEEEIRDVADRIMCICGRYLGIGETKSSIDLYKECLDFVRDRLGRLDCADSRSLRGDGVRLNHLIICRLLVDLGKVCFGMETDSHCISYLSEARELLVQRKDAGLNESEMWELLLNCHHRICEWYIQRGQWEKVKHHCVEYVATARECNVTDQVDYLITALGMLCDCVRAEFNFPVARALAEESYTIASKHYSPAHRKVVRAARSLIDCHTDMKDYSTADTYCRMNYSNYLDPMNAGEYSVDDRVDTMGPLVDIWLRKEPDDDEIVEKALADEAIDLSRKICALEKESRRAQSDLNCLSALCQVLLKANQLTEETEGLQHQLAKSCTTDI